MNITFLIFKGKLVVSNHDARMMREKGSPDATTKNNAMRGKQKLYAYFLLSL